MSTIVTRTGKGSALTWAEGDANFSNLNADKLENIALRGDSGSDAVITSNEIVRISGGTGLSSVVTAESTGQSTVTINLDNTTVTPNTYTLATITVDAQGRITSASSGTGGGGLSNVVEDLTPQLGGALDVNGYAITSASNGNISITPNGTGSVIIDGNTHPQTQGAANQILVADGAGLLEWRYPERIMAYVYNADSVTINKGQPVYVFGAQGDQISVKLAVNTGDSTSAQTLGLANENIASTASGYVVCQGPITNIDTSTPGYSAGQALYLGSTAGAITTTKPYEPNHLVYLGFVEKVNASSGRIYVRTQNGYELDEIHDVNINHAVALANNHYLRYNSSSTRWENNSLDISHDTAPNLGGNLDVSGYSIVSTSNGNITLAPDGTGDVYMDADTIRVGDLNSAVKITANGTGTLTLTTNDGTASTSIQVTYGNSNDILLTAGGKVRCITPTTRLGNGASNATLTTAGAYDLILNTNDGTSSSSITIQDAANGNIQLAPNGTGRVEIIGTSTSSGAIKLYEELTSAGNTNSVTLRAPQILQADITLTLPSTTTSATLGYLNIPAVGAKTGSYTLQTTDVGEYVEVQSGGSITIPNSTFSAGDIVVIVNNHSAAITITCSITDAYIAGTDTDKATVSLATRGIANIFFVSATRCIITGNVT